MMDDSLFSRLAAYGGTMLPLHMPGHKRRAMNPCLQALGAQYDITEVEGMDNLHDASGILQAGMDKAAALWGSRRAFFLVNGSTCGILAAIHSCTRPGEEILVARNCHKSVYNAIALRGLRPVYLLPPQTDCGICGGIAPEAVAAALEAHPALRAVILTSPNYEGVVSDIAAISQLCHAHGAVLLVDEAHGAHFGFGHGFPESAVRQGADVVVQSLHKTLPSLTQTALLHLCSERVSAEKLAQALAIYESSSPSYLLMASIDACVRQLEQEGEGLFARWEEALAAFYAGAARLEKLRLFSCPGRDKSKLVVCTDAAGISGSQLADRLREKGIEVEMASLLYLVAMTGLGDSRETLARFLAALLEIDRSLRPCPQRATPPVFCPPEVLLPPGECAELPGEFVPLCAGGGRVSLEYVWAYPPGVPLLAPGERIAADFSRQIARYQAGGVLLQSSRGQLPEKIFVRKCAPVLE